MKCPKCSFISFDYNQTCPKCGKDLSNEKDLLNLPSYKPKPLPLLGGLTGGSEIPDHETMIEQSEILEEHPEAAEELLISLDTISDDEPEPIQLEPEPASSSPETEMEDQADDAVEGLSISLDELTVDEPELSQLEPEPAPIEAEPEKETEAGDAFEGLSISLDDLSDDEPESIPFEPELEPSAPETEIEDNADKPEKNGLWDTQAIDERMADMQLDDATENQDKPFDSGEEAPVKAEEKESPFELEIEPLEIDIELEEPDKKTS